VPSGEEPDPVTADVWQSDSDHSDDELDVSRPVRIGARRSKRPRSDRQRAIGSYMLDSSQIELSENSDAGIPF
jgi:hypothetical protein